MNTKRTAKPFANLLKLGLGAAIALASGPADANQPLSLKTPAALVIEGTSTVRAFSCEAKNPQLSASGKADELNLTTGSLVVKVADIDCKNNTMNNHLRNAMKAKDHPSISFRLERQQKGEASGSGVKMKLHGDLTILDNSHPVVIEGVATPDGQGGLHFVGEHELNMSQWGVEAPRLMMGTMRVGEMVTIRYDLQLTGSGDSSAQAAQ